MVTGSGPDGYLGVSVIRHPQRRCRSGIAVQANAVQFMNDSTARPSASMTASERGILPTKIR
jgi:hypothetical protein